MFLQELTGFESYSPLISIFDKRGNCFYYFENQECERITFNLIPGHYTLGVGARISPLQQPLRYVCPSIPRAERNLRIPENFDVDFSENRNKASVDLKNGFAIVDTEYEQGDTPQLVFLQYHELGHYKYGTEWKCDVFAAYQMIKRGYNPSQCYYANACCLSEKNHRRKNILLAWLKKVKCYER